MQIPVLERFRYDAVREGGSAEAERRRSTWQHSLPSFSPIRGRKEPFDFLLILNHIPIGIANRNKEGRLKKERNERVNLREGFEGSKTRI